jgi:hypothetical protein
MEREREDISSGIMWGVGAELAPGMSGEVEYSLCPVRY